MSERPAQNLDASATMVPLEHVRQTLDQALMVYGADPRLRRAFIHGIGAIDDTLRAPREWPNRRERRQR